MKDKSIVKESGSIGADRIPRSAVQPTVEFFIEKILKGFEGFKSAKIAGSYNSGVKKDHGDIDLVVYVEQKDLRQVRREFKEYVTNLPDNIALPFRAGTHKGKKVQLFGRTATCEVSMQGFEGLSVQVDCSFVSSEQEQEFKTNYLSVETVKQKLMVGLVRIILVEEKSDQVFARLKITKLPNLDKNQFFEFNLEDTGLVLNRITVEEDIKNSKIEQVWKSVNWKDVDKLLVNYDLTQDFYGLVQQVSDKLKHTSSKRRIFNFIQNNVRIGTREKETAKGDEEQRALGTAKKLLNGEIETLDEEETEGAKNVALYGGEFKPPYKVHFTTAKKLCKGQDKLIIFINKEVRAGVPVTAEQSKQVWEIYAHYLTIPVEVRIADESPMLDIRKLLENPELKDVSFTVFEGTEEEYRYLLNNKEKYTNAKLVKIPGDKEGEQLTASTLKQSIGIFKKGTWIPSELSREDMLDVLNIVLKPIEKESTEMNIQEGMREVLQDLEKSFIVQENSSGTPVAPTSIISSVNKAKLAQFYGDLEKALDLEKFSVNFNQSFILISSLANNERELGDLYTKLYNNYSNSFNFHFNLDCIEVTPLYRPDWEKQNIEGGYSTDANADNLDETAKTVLAAPKIKGKILDQPGNQTTLSSKLIEDLSNHIASYLHWLHKSKGLSLQTLPEIKISTGGQDEEGDIMKDSTGNYNPETKTITMYVSGRHPKDILRSFAHEFQHFLQDQEGRITNIKGSKITEDEHLTELEREATDRGYLLFREWTESL